MTDRRRTQLAVLSGFVFATATPPINFELGILLGLAGFAFALQPSALEDRERGGRAGFLFGLAANITALRFVPEVIHRFTGLPSIAGWVALVLLACAQSLPWIAAGLVARWCARRLDAPWWLAFATGVFVALFVPSVFPWTPAGGVARWPLMLQTAEIIGERGTSFLLAAAMALVATSVERVLESSSGARARAAAAPIAVAVAIFVVLLGYGALRSTQIASLRDAAPHAKIALLQPDFDAFDRWSEDRSTMMMQRLSSLTRRAEEAGAELTVWPESAYPYTLPHGTRQSPRGARAILQGGAHGPVLTGAYLSKGGGLGTNAAILATHDGSISRSYDKRHLLWFGETVPLADYLPLLRRIFSRGTGLVAGDEEIAFEHGAIVAAVLNCYEDTLPQAGREAMSVRPNLLVNITNDAWFAGSAEGELHLRLAVLRAIETRRDLVRAVNRGPTSWVDATGAIRARRESAPGLGPSPPLVVDAALLDAPVTLYSRAGDLPLTLLLAAALVFYARKRTAR